MKVSVVIPVFNRQDDATSALRSVVAQDGVPFEVVIVDDGSHEPYRLPAEFAGDQRVRIIRQHRNRGAPAARNRGVAETSAPWVAFLDSDDLWRPGKLARQLAFAEKGLASGWPPLTNVMTGFRQLDVATGAARLRVPRSSTDPADFASGCWFGPGTTALVPRSAFAAVGPFDESLERLEDLDWYLRLALAGGGVATLERIEADVQVGSRPAVARLERACSKLARKWIAPDAPHRLPPGLRRRLRSYLAVERASARLHNGDKFGCAVAMVESWMLKPRTRLHLRDWWPTPAAG